jgi:hypothetical protein
MNRVVLMVGTAAISAATLACGASPDGSGQESTGSTSQASTSTTWPINSDCTCPSAGSISWQLSDECSFAQKFLEDVYKHGATWNGGSHMRGDPASHGSGVCANSNLPPLTAVQPWGIGGTLLQTPALRAADGSGLYDSLTNYWDNGLMWQYMPYGGVEYQDQPVMLTFMSGDYNNNNTVWDFEPTNCSTCFRNY